MHPRWTAPLSKRFRGNHSRVVRPSTYGPREVELIAEIVRHHRKGSPEGELVARCSLLLRLAEQLDRGQDQSVHEARLVAERRLLRLRLRGDDRLARWSLERRLSDGAFRRVFGRRLVVTP